MMNTAGDMLFSLKAERGVVAKKENFKEKFSQINQYLSGILLMPVFHLFFSLNIFGEENFKKSKKPLIIVSNHIAFYDSFLFRLIATYSHLPLRFMAVDRFDWPLLNILGKLGFIKFIYSLFGVFTIIPGMGIESNLEKPKQILKDGGIVVIYPEGRINISDTIGSFKKGAAVLAQYSGVPVLPIVFRRKGHTFFRRKISLVIGKTFFISKGKSGEEATDILRNKMLELFKKT